MTKPKFLFTIVISTFSWFFTQGQDIHDLPYSFNEFSLETINDNFKKLHEFSERIYASKKLKSNINSIPGNHLFSNDNWPLGTWGNGYFSESLHERPYPQANTYINWGTYTIPKDNCKNRGWYDCFIDKHENNEISFLSAHPLTWHTGQRVVAYIHAYKYEANPIYLQRIKEGLQYLVTEQNESGGYNWYFRRASQNSTEDHKVKEDYTHGIGAMRALSEGYMFLNSINDYSMNMPLWSAITKGGDFLEKRYYQGIKNDKGEYIDKKFVSQPINGRAWFTWGLIAVYKATGKNSYLTLINELTEEYLNYQREDGSWETQDQTDLWHDSQMTYHGIILRGISELYDLTNDNIFKAKLRNAIIKSINHTVDYNKKGNSLNSTRLRPDGFVIDFHEDYPKFSSTNIRTGTRFLMGLLYARKHVDFLQSDLEKIDQLINYNFTALFSEINKHKVPALNMICLGLYLNSDFSYRNLVNVGSIHTNNVTFDMMSPVDFDNSGTDELALYDADSKLYNIFKNNSHSVGYSQNTTNGTLFNLMTSGDFDGDGKDEVAFYRSTYSDGLVSITNEDLSWRGSIKTYNTNFDMIAPFDFDNDGFKDIVLYDKEAKSLKIYKNKINTPVFSGNTVNGPLNDLMTSGDFDGDGEDEIAFYRNYDGRITILNGDLSWEASIRSNATNFDMITSIDYDNDGLDEIVLYNSATNLLKMYKIGSDQALFARYTNNGVKFDLMTSGNFDSGSGSEIAFYRKSDGKVSILKINNQNSNKNSNIIYKPHTGTTNLIEDSITNDILKFNITSFDRNDILIQYLLLEKSNVTLEFFDLNGRKLRTIINGYQNEGEYEFSFNTNNCSSGTYVVKISTDYTSQSVKLFVN